VSLKERLESRLSIGEAVDLDQFGRLQATIAESVRTLGIERRRSAPSHSAEQYRAPDPTASGGAGIAFAWIGDDTIRASESRRADGAPRRGLPWCREGHSIRSLTRRFAQTFRTNLGQLALPNDS
jgi:hypothetical protein